MFPMIKQAKRQYPNKYPSVTQVLDVLRKIGLEQWFKNNTLDFISRESAKGKLIGTQIHEAIQSHIEDNELKVETEYADEVTNALKSFMLFKREHPEIILRRSEVMLTSEFYKYNGTMDALGEIDGQQIIFDWKSGTAKEKEKPDIYDEYIYQVSAYVHAYNEMFKTDINRAFILALAKDKVAYNFREINVFEINGSFSEVFLSALNIWYYKNDKKGERKNGIHNGDARRETTTSLV